MSTTTSQTTLKGGSFLVEETAPQDIFIPEEFNEEQQMIAETVRDFCMQEIHSLGIEKVVALDASKDLPFIIELLEKAGEMGLCGLSIEEEYGGMDTDFNTGLLAGEAISIGFSFATTLGAQISIGSLPIVYYGTDQQKERYLPGIASGEIKSCYCLTEPSAGSDANSGKAKAVLNEAKTHYRLNGQKMWITNGGFADLFIVFAKIEDDEDLSAFIVEKAFGGITLGKEEKKLGIKASSTVQVFFNDCMVPVENLLSDRGAGFKIALNILNTGRAKLAAGAVGGCKFAISASTEYANERKQFKKSISEFGAIKYKIGEMTIRTFAVESALYRTGYNIDRKYDEFIAQGLSPSDAKLKAVREFAVEASILKVVGSEALDYAVDEAIQIHGGMGYSADTGIEMGYRDARITRIYEGTNEINRMLAVGELLKRAFRTKEVDLRKGIKSLPWYFIKQLNPFKSFSNFAEEERLIKHIKQIFILISSASGRRMGMKMVDEQEIIINLADILSEAYITESLLLRIQKLHEKGEDSKRLEVLTQLLQAYLYEALHRVRKSAEDAIYSYATGFERGFLLYLLGMLTPRYKINPKEARRAVANYVIDKGSYCF